MVHTNFLQTNKKQQFHISAHDYLHLFLSKQH